MEFKKHIAKYSTKKKIKSFKKRKTQEEEEEMLKILLQLTQLIIKAKKVSIRLSY